MYQWHPQSFHHVIIHFIFLVEVRDFHLMPSASLHTRRWCRGHFLINSRNFTFGYPLLVDDPKISEGPPCPLDWVGLIRLTGMLPSIRGVKFGSNPIELANHTFKCLCFLLGHLKILLELFDSSSPIIQLRFAIVFNNTVNCVYKHNLNVLMNTAASHLPQTSNPKLARV